MKPLIGITGREFPYGNVAEAPEVLAHVMVDVVLCDYVDAVLASGGIPIHLPMRVDPAELIGRIDGLILSGGADIDPVRYNDTPDPDLGPLEPNRDSFEFAITEQAIAAGLPTLGICRGVQLLNVATGGTLAQHVPEHARLDLPGDAHTHHVEFAEGSTLQRLYGAKAPVNSLHHQSVATTGDSMRVVGTADDGGIEALEHKTLPIIGVQWHPEMFRQREPVFDWLVNEAANA